jgi:POT family proton-dependent oligopeptide transporter
MNATGNTPVHPRGLYTLFLTEMWERFSYYGMRALLVLFMVDQIQKGGLGFTDKTATAIYGLYTAAVYLAALPGGWVADRLLGAQKAVLFGGIAIACGEFCLAIPRIEAFYIGLTMIVLGTGLLKPNISVIVGQLYPEGGARRDAGFTLFYMGINLGAALGPLVCGWLRIINWRYGFVAAGLGMVLGLIQFRLTSHHLGEAGKHPSVGGKDRRRDWRLFQAGLAAIGLVMALSLTGVLPINPIVLAGHTTTLIVGIALLYFIFLFFFAGLDKTEKKRMGVIAILFLSSAMFWSGFEQAGSSLSLFAERHTLRTYWNHEVPAEWFQSLNPFFIITLAPVVAMVWVILAKRKINLSLLAKFAIGLLLLGAGFFVMNRAALLVMDGSRVWPSWLIATFLLHSVGELCLSPVGLSSVTKLAPPRLAGQMMGIWFLATSLGNLMAGLIAGEVSGELLNQMPSRFMQIVLTAGATGVALLILAKPIRGWMKGVD